MLKRILRLITPGTEISAKIYYRYKINRFFYEHKYNRISKFLTYRLYRKYNCYISPKAILGKNINFPHPLGIVIGDGVVIGKNCTIYQNVTLGRKNKDIPEYPAIGNNVIIYCNSTVIGNISVGDDSIIGCNSVVLKSIEKGTKCIGVVK